MSKRKYRKGGPILSLDELAKQEFVYWYDKIMHREWVMSWQLRMIVRCIGPRGCISYAIKNEDIMKKFYLGEKTNHILNQAEYDRCLKNNEGNDTFVLLGEFVDKSQARRYLYQTYLPKRGGSYGD